MKDLPLTSLREDKHFEYEEKLIEKLKHYKENFVRAPKMV